MSESPMPRASDVPVLAPPTALDRQVMAERAMVRAIIRSTLLAIPIAIAVVIGMLAWAVSDTQPWYVWVGLGAGLGVYCAGFFGVMAGALTSAHRLDSIEENSSHH